MGKKTFLTLMGVALLVGGCGNRTASPQDATQTDTISADASDVVQSVAPEPSRPLPEGAVKADETDGYAVYTKLVQAGSEDNPVHIRSLWLYDQKTGGVDSLLTTNPFADLRWAEMTDGPVEVALTQIAAADKVCFVPGHPQLLLVEGCPEARNIWTYIVDLGKKTARQFPSTEGLLRFSASGDTLILGAYRYHEEGGRYSVAKTYTLDGQFVKEEKLEEY